MTREDKVNEFYKAGAKKTFEQFEDLREALDQVELCINIHDEETTELFDAIDFYMIERSEENRAQLCKEWADCQYTLSQIAVLFDIPADAAFNRVHNSNMTKVIEGKVVYRDDGKILKPDTYVAPDMRGL